MLAYGSDPKLKPQAGLQSGNSGKLSLRQNSEPNAPPKFPLFIYGAFFSIASVSSRYI